MTAIVQKGRVAETTQYNRRCTSKANQSCLMLTAGGVLVVGATLAIVLCVDLAKPTDETSSTNQQQQLMVYEDPYSIGCYADDRSSRVMPHVYTDDVLTPSLCNDHCEEHGYFYYALQSGVECWCGHEDVEIDKYGTGICEKPCGGDINSICGGYHAFTAYAVDRGQTDVDRIDIRCRRALQQHPTYNYHEKRYVGPY